MDVQTLTTRRLARNHVRAARQSGDGSTDQGMAVVSQFFDETKEYVSTLVKPEELNVLSDEIISLLVLQASMTSVGHFDTLSKTIWYLGDQAEREVYAAKLRDKAEGSTEAKETIDRITKSAMKRSSISQRRYAFNAASQKAGLGSTPWTRKVVARIGAWLLDIALVSPVFTRVDDPFDCITLSQVAIEVRTGLVQRLMETHPVMLPLMVPPPPWVASTTVLEGYRHMLVRKRSPVTQAAIRASIKSGAMVPVLEAINGVQATSYLLNPIVIDMVQWAHQNDLSLEGFPRLSDLPEPPKIKLWDDMTEDEQKVWKKSASDIKRANLSYAAEREILSQDLAIAEHIGDRPFWTPANMDWRGRVYFIPYFNFQRQDHIRAMFMFAEGKPLDTDGLYWLKVHLANNGDFGKISKAPFDERVAWVDTNMLRLMDMAVDPTSDLWWTEADSPFQFLAAASALLDHVIDPTSSCHLPVSFDGTCSGLQHLAAMTKCQDTAPLVNLSKTDKPGDVYATVATKANAAIMGDIGGEHDAVASLCLAFGVNRSLVKRNVMTYSYSSGRFGMADQQMEDTMKPLSFKVLAKEINEHPFLLEADTALGRDGKPYTRAGKTAARYLAGHIYSAIENTVQRPALAMKYLQSLAKAAAHEGKALVWHTPLGMPVVLRCPVYSTSHISLFLHDRGVKARKQIVVQDVTNGIDKAKAASAVAPCFVHSMDATHLQQVVRWANAEGIHSLALVHDSFGCLPTDAGKFRHIIKTAFDWLYKQDVLKAIHKDTVERLDNTVVPEYEAYGSYNSSQIMEAEYAFA